MMRSIAILALAMVMSSVSQAKVVELEYKSAQGQDIEAVSSQMILPAHNDLFAISIAGLDRKLRTVVYNGDQLVSSHTSKVIGVNDRLTDSSGNEFYGIRVPLQPVPEGTYSIIQKTLDLDNREIDSVTYTLTVDTQEPTVSTFFWSSFAYNIDNITNGQWLGSFEVWRHGFRGITDNTGIASVEVYASDVGQTAPLGNVVSMTYNPSSQSAELGGYPNIFPRTEYSYDVHAVVTDRAGNQGRLTRTIVWTGRGPEPVPVAVSDGTYSGNFLPGSPFHGFKAYSPGMPVNNYAIKLVYRIPKAYADPSNPGRFMSKRNEFTVNEYINGDYAYFQVSTYYATDRNTHQRPLARHDRWVAHFLFYNLTLAPTLAPPPAVTSRGLYFDGLGWITNRHEINLGNKIANPKPRYLKVTVEPRNYAQKLIIQGMGLSNCTVPAGQTECVEDISHYPWAYWSHRAGQSHITNVMYRHFWHTMAAKADYHNLRSSPMGGLNVHVDLNNPQINSVTRVPKEKAFTINASKHEAGAVWNLIQLSSIGLEFTSVDTGKVYRFTKGGSQGSRDYGWGVVPVAGAAMEDIVEFEVPDGQYRITALATDTFNNTARLAVAEVLTVDNRPPLLRLENSNGEALSGKKIGALQDIRITVDDDTAVDFDRIILSGGRFNDNVALGYFIAGEKRYSLETPRLFPNLEEGETYTLSVSVSDDFGNKTTQQASFRYEPENNIRLETITTLPSSTVLRYGDNTPVSQIVFEGDLTTDNGNKATGEQFYFVTLSRDADFPIKIETTTIHPGQTRQLTIDLGENGSQAMHIPIETVYAAEGEAEIMVEVPQLTSRYD